MKLNFHEEHPFLPFDLSGRLYPMVPVKLTGKRGLFAETFALLDSGADDCLFHARWARKIGLDLKSGRLEYIGGIDPSTQIACYSHLVYLTVGQNVVRCPVAFSDEIGEEMNDQLVGRNIVFDRMRFALRQRVGKLYIGSNP